MESTTPDRFKTLFPLFLIGTTILLASLLAVVLFATPLGAEVLAGIPEDSLLYRLGICH